MNPLRPDTKPQSIALQLFVVKVLCRYHLAERICGFTFFPCQTNAHEDAPAISQMTSPSATKPLLLSVDQVQRMHLEEENHTRLMTASGVGSNYPSFPRTGHQGNLIANEILLVTSALEKRKNCFPSICLPKDLGSSLGVVCEDRSPVVCRYMYQRHVYLQITVFILKQ